jgi:hypothetical protein
MIVIGYVIKDLFPLLKRQGNICLKYSVNVLNLADNTIYIISSSGIVQPLRIFLYVSYIFYDKCRELFYTQDRNNNYVINRCLTVRDDDNLFLYTIKNGKFVDKERLNIQYITGNLVTGLNDLTIVIALLAPFEEIVYQEGTQNFLNRNPIDRNSGIIDNLQWYITTTLIYAHYPKDQNNINKVVVSNVISKSEIQVPQSEDSTINFSSLILNQISGRMVVKPGVGPIPNQIMQLINTMIIPESLGPVTFLLNPKNLFTGSFRVNETRKYRISIALNRVRVTSSTVKFGYNGPNRQIIVVIDNSNIPTNTITDLNGSVDVNLIAGNTYSFSSNLIGFNMSFEAGSTSSIKVELLS